MRLIPPRTVTSLLTGLIVMLTAGLAMTRAADAPKKVTFEEHVAPVFRSRCGTCHNADKQKGGLNLDTFGATMQGGGSGKVVEPGDPDGSTLLRVVSHQEEPKMPPRSPKIPDAEIDVIRRWIEAGAPENSGSVATARSKPKFEFKLDPSAMGKPAGPPAMPASLSTEPFIPQAKAGAVLAMAASPWAPLLAMAGHKQVVLYRTTDFRLVGVLPFPEGTIHTLKFSRSGDLLLAGGGRGGQSGLAVAWDVKKGNRVFEVGKEYDAVLAADISPDHGLVALGGPGKIVRVYNTADGSLAFEMKKHTEWITAAEFSPDGALLATGDRNNGLIVWEAQTGREFHDLRGHTSAITDVTWRPDSNVLASASEDGTVKLWEMENGTAIKSIGAHGGGALAVRFAKDGRLVTAGRDRVVRLWDPSGNKQRDFEGFGDLAMRVATTSDAGLVVGSDFSGEVRAWDARDGRRLANLVPNPAPVAVRLEQASRQLVAARAEAESLSRQLAPVQEAATSASQKADQARAQVVAAEKALAEIEGLVRAREKSLKEKAESIVEAHATLKAAEQLALRTNAAAGEAREAAAKFGREEKSATEALAAARAGFDTAAKARSAHEAAMAAAATALSSATTPEAAAVAAEGLDRESRKAVELIQGVAAAGSRIAASRRELARIAAARAAAPQAAVDAGLVARAAAMAVPAAREAITRADREKAAAEAALAEAVRQRQTVADRLAATKSALAQATTAANAAQKALAEKRAGADPVIARARSLQAEVDDLIAEKRRAGENSG